VEAAFTTFVEELGLDQSSEKNLTDGVTPLSKAYYAFWEAHKAATAALKAARKGD
jgi:hypothetical protein